MLRNNLRKSVLLLALADAIWLHRYLNITNIWHFDIMVTQTTSDSYPGQTMEVSERPKEKWILSGYLAQTDLSSSCKPELSFLGVWFSSALRELSGAPLKAQVLPGWEGHTGASKGESRSASWQVLQSPSSSASSRSEISAIQQCLPGGCPASSWGSQVRVMMEFLFHGGNKEIPTSLQMMFIGDLLTEHLMELLQNRGKRENG